MKVQYSFSLCLIIACSLPTILNADSPPRDYDPKAAFCETEACVKAANYMSQNMNRNVGACDNFYQHACGGFLSRMKFKPEQSSITTFTLIGDILKETLKSFVTENNSHFEKLMTYKKLRQFYDICLADYERTESNNEYLKILKVLGDWPVVVGASWNQSNFEWTKTVLQLSTEGLAFDVLFGVSMVIGVKDNTKWSILIDQGELGLDEKHLKNGWDDEIVKAYYKYMMSVAVQFKATEELAMKECREVIDFEMQLTNIMQSYQVRQQNLLKHEFLTIDQLQTSYSYVQWLDHLKKLFPPSVDPNNYQQVVLVAPEYFSKLNALIQSTEKRIVANYVLWLATKAVASFLGPNIRSAQSEFNKALTGSLLNPARQEICYVHVLEKFPLAISSIYVQNYVNNTDKPLVREMFENIRRSLSNVITEVKWMEKETKDKALKKLSLMEPAIAYPQELLDDTKVDGYYNDFQLVNGDFLRTVLNFNKFFKKTGFAKLNKTIERIDWTTEFGEAIKQEAYSNPQGNVIIVPSGITQDYFYNKSRPMFLNYAALGSFVGHEIMHGYDNLGRMFDDVGNLNDWWDSKSAEEYTSKAKCIVDQYSNYNLSQTAERINGENTQGENIADNGGLNVTYLAYRNWLNMNNSTEPKLRGFEMYTEQQMFWLTYANTWCQTIRPEQLTQMILSDVHSPFEARVNIPLANSEAFARDFNCPQGSPMNATNKCVIW